MVNKCCLMQVRVSGDKDYLRGSSLLGVETPLQMKISFTHGNFLCQRGVFWGAIFW